MNPATQANAPVAITCRIHFLSGTKGRRRIHAGAAPPPAALAVGRVPRVARLMALAIRFDGLLRSGEIASQADLASIGHITRARVTQIMNLLHLAPDLQEDLLHLPLVESGRDPITERGLRSVAELINWDAQRRLWQALLTC